MPSLLIKFLPQTDGVLTIPFPTNSIDAAGGLLGFFLGSTLEYISFFFAARVVRTFSFLFFHLFFVVTFAWGVPKSYLHTHSLIHSLTHSFTHSLDYVCRY